MNYYGVAWSFRDSLTHYGIKGQRWGIRRFQYENGSYTPEGKERYYKDYDRGVKKGKYDNDPELRDLYAMEQKEISDRAKKVWSSYSDQIQNNSRLLSKKDKALLGKLKSGEMLSEKEKAGLIKTYRSLSKQNGKVYDDYFKKSDHAKEDEVAKRLLEGLETCSDLDYAIAFANEMEYLDKRRDWVNDSKMKRFVDPSYRTFSSKDEKAKAEYEYLSTYTTDPDLLDPKYGNEYGAEWEHMHQRINGLSMDGYNGVPKSDRTKKMFLYNDSDSGKLNVKADYNNWTPKYEKNPEYIALQKQEDRNNTEFYKNEQNLYKPLKDAETSGKYTKKELDKFYKSYLKSYNKLSEDYHKEARRIYDAKKAIARPFSEELCKCVLQDMGYELTPQNIEAISYLIFLE